MKSDTLLYQAWTWIFSFGPNDYVVASIATLIIHEIVYFAAYLPFFVADFIPSLKKYKIQMVTFFLKKP